MKKFRKFLAIFSSVILTLILLFVILKAFDTRPPIMTIDRLAQSDEVIDKKARELVDQMSLEERVAMMTPALKSNFSFIMEIMSDGMKYNHQAYAAGGNERLGIPSMRFFDGPRGMVSGEATCFPVAMQRAASFDPDLERRIGEAIGKEIRANGGNYFGGVCINLLRHPAGGRAQESYGEDSYLLGQMGTALMRGVQTHNVMACIKHYALNNQENTRFDINVDCDERVLREVYLAHFKECIDNGAASVMGAYNRFRGEQCCESSYLLRTVLKEDWDFKGFTISDFAYGVRNTEKAANGGLDIEMPATNFYGENLVKAVNEGKVSADLIDDAAFRITSTILKFETAPDPLPLYQESLIGSTDHVALALEVAEKSMVLLKNENSVLPLDPSKIKKVLVLGDRAVAENIGDHGSSRVRPKYVVTPMQGLEKLYGDRINFEHYSGEDIAKTKELAKSADAVIFVVGYSHDDEGEFMDMGFGEVGGDRTSIRLHENESKLLVEVGPENVNSIAVLIGGSAIVVEEWKDKISGIIHAFYPGMEGGTAITKTIFGVVNPGGKLPFTIPADESHLPAFDRLGISATYDRYHGYIKLDHDGRQAAFPFGFGLSYTTFTQDSAAFNLADGNMEFSINVTNIGQRAGDQVVQLYIGFDNSTVEREHKLLKGFQRVSLEPGETKRVKISCPMEKLKWYNPETNAWELEKMNYEAYLGSSSDEKDLVKMSFAID
jgi:beta-glucosidase